MRFVPSPDTASFASMSSPWSSSSPRFRTFTQRHSTIFPHRTSFNARPPDSNCHIIARTNGDIEVDYRETTPAYCVEQEKQQKRESKRHGEINRRARTAEKTPRQVAQREDESGCSKQEKWLKRKQHRILIVDAGLEHGSTFLRLHNINRNRAKTVTAQPLCTIVHTLQH